MEAIKTDAPLHVKDSGTQPVQITNPRNEEIPTLCTIHLSVGSFATLTNAQEVAADLGYVSATGKTKGRGSLSQLVAAIGRGELLVVPAKPNLAALEPAL